MRKDAIKLNEVNKEDIKTIFNASYRKRAEVLQFGQTIANPNLLERPELIDTLDILCDLYDEAEAVFDLTAFDMHNLEGTELEIIEDYEVDHLNTYNWSAPLTNDMDIKVYKTESYMFFSVAIHNGYGDARTGYMIEFIFKFDTSYIPDDWATLLSELPSSNKSLSYDDYEFSFNMFSESGSFDIWHRLAKDNDIYNVYIGDYDDCVNWVNERKEETTLND